MNPRYFPMSQEMQKPPPTPKTELSNQLRQDVEAFLARGGKPEEVPAGKTGVAMYLSKTAGSRVRTYVTSGKKRHG